MTNAPERVWRSNPHHPSGYAHGLASWPVKEHAEPGAIEYVRADISQAAIAAAYEAAANAAKGDGESEWFNPIRAIRAITPADALASLEAVKREAFNEGVRSAAIVAEDANDDIWDRETGEKVCMDSVAKEIRALLKPAKEPTDA